MLHRQLSTTLAALVKSLHQTEQLVIAASRWSSASFPEGTPKFSVRHRQILIELAFLRAFLAWEAFLEESFILYVWGKKPPKGNPPQCYVSPPTRKVAEQLLIPVGRSYTEWSQPQNVAALAQRFFKDGKPYSPVLKAHQNKLQDIKTIRNAIAHSSAYSWQAFQRLARRELATFRPGLTIGGFLTTTIPGSSPPESFFEHYLGLILLAAEQIVPT